MCPSPSAVSTRHASLESDDGESGTQRSSPAHLSPDDRYHVLQTSRRRETIRYLLEVEPNANIRDLAEWVASREQGIPIEQLDSSQRQRVYISLYQTHLPKLDAYDIVVYEKDRGRIERTDRIQEFRPYLEHSGSEPTGERPTDDSWQPYAVLTGISGVVVVLTMLELLPVPPLSLAGGIVVLFGLLTSGHAWRSKIGEFDLTQRLEGD